VPASDLPAAIQGALQSGKVDPQMAQGVIGSLFPGVPPAQLPTALTGSFAGFSPDQIQGILGAIYPGQNLQMPQIRSGEGAVAYAAWENGDRPSIYLVNADGSGKRLLIEQASEPAFSPDGSQLAYFSWRDDALGLRIRNMNTGADRALTNSSDDYWPTWSPDSRRLVFYNDPDGLQIINADGTDRRGIGQGEFPAWSPRGDRIAMKGCAGAGCGIVLINPDGSNPVQITTNANDGQPAWSPDGRSIAFVSNRDGNWEIYAVNADGSWLRRITDDVHTDGLPAWASDGMRIAFRSDRTGTWAIYTATGAGGPPVKLIDAPVHGGDDYPWDVETISWR
jgi:Tol biopolymer transport system component